MPQVLDPMRKNETIIWVLGLFVLVGGIYGYALFTTPTAISKAKISSPSASTTFTNTTASSTLLIGISTKSSSTTTVSASSTLIR